MTKLLLVGEALGSREHLFEHGFVGSSGVELARMLGEVGLGPVPAEHPSELQMIKYWKEAKDKFDIDITNVFNAHPQDNKIELFFANAKDGGLLTHGPMTKGKFIRPDLLHHVEALWDLVATLRPNLTIAFGNTACWALIGETKIGTIRGTIKTSPKLGIKVLPTYHPAAVLRQWNLRTIVLTDLEKAKREAEFAHVERIKRFVTVEPTLDEIAEWLTRDASYYAVDIETRLNQISMIGFARSAHDAIVIPFIEERHTDWNYWKCAKDEILAWKLVDQLLRRNVPKIFQNGVFDLSWLLRAGLRPTMCDADTMLLHHSIFPEMLKGLGFLGSVYSDELSWKQMRTRGDNIKRDE